MRTRLLAFAALAGFAAFLLVPSSLRAQPLADRVPDDAVLYVGWSGAESMGTGYEQSHLKAVMDASNLPELIDDFLPALMKRASEMDGGPSDEEMAEAAKVIGALGAPLWKRPSALYVGGIDWKNPDQPTPRLALICQAGDLAGDMYKQLQDALKQVPPDAPVKVTAAKVDQTVVLAVGFPRAEAALVGGLKGAKTKSLAANADFQKALSQVHKENAAVAVYLDGKRLMAEIDKGLNAAGNDADVREARQKWPQLREALGLNGFQRLIWTEGFEGKEWGSRAFVAAPAPRKGLLSLIEAKPVSNELLKAIPQSATMAGVFRFDFAKLLTEARNIARELDPEAPEQMDQALAQANEMAGMDIETDLLAALGDEWALYSDPMTGGKGLMGWVFINRVRDAEKVEASLTQTETLLNNLSEQILRSVQGDSEPKVTLRIRQAKLGDVTVHYLAVPLASPGWAVKDGNLYVALFPQVVADAAAQGASGKNSILDNKAFAALHKELGGGKASSLQWIDLPSTAPDAYGGWLMISRVVGFGDLFGVESPAVTFPSMRTLSQHLTPALTATWTDAAGWHLHGRTPFPGAQVLAQDPLTGLSPQMMMLGGFGQAWEAQRSFSPPPPVEPVEPLETEPAPPPEPQVEPAPEVDDDDGDA